MRWRRFALPRGRLIAVLWGTLGIAQFYLAANSEGSNRLGFAAPGCLWLGTAAFGWTRPDIWDEGTNFHRRDYQLVAVLFGSLGLSILVLWAFRFV